MLGDNIIKQMNNYGKNKIPFLFVIDFDAQTPILIPISEIDYQNMLFYINGFTNQHAIAHNIKSFSWDISPISFPEYNKAFEIVKRNLELGNSYLTNLTFPTKIQTNLSLNEIFKYSKAKYRLHIKDKFTVFSPETFIKIENSKIYSFPMKGTIDADIPNAESIILSDQKELSEHHTIVDLIRNDLSIVAKKVTVDAFRYIDKIKTHHKSLLQVSSKISGELPGNWQENIGNILDKLLPAGSICGAPKLKTVEIIKEAENYCRGYYTGVMGVFDGKKLDSGVMIRFIEKEGNQLIYKSGGGITASSNPKLEYQELIDKIYVPITTGIYQNS